MESALPRSLRLVAFSLALLLFGVASSLYAAPPPPVASPVVSSETLLTPSSCTNESRTGTVAHSTLPGSQAPFWQAVNSCGEICLANCEAFCGVGYGRCNPMSSCACECW